MCLICGATSPGYGCQWQRNYTHCGPCHSKISCPVCRMRYHEEELIIQCVQCDRYVAYSREDTRIKGMYTLIFSFTFVLHLICKICHC